MKKISIVSPVKNMTGVKALAKQHCNESINIECVGIDTNIEGVATFFDWTIIAPEILKLSYLATKHNTDGIIINCLTEPGLYACKELLNIPVIGFFEVIFNTISHTAGNHLLLFPDFHPNYKILLQHKINEYHTDANLILVSLNVDCSKEQQLTALENIIVKHARALRSIILTSTYLANAHHDCISIVKKHALNANVIIPLDKSIEYMISIINGDIKYEKHLSPPKDEKIKLWL